MADTIDYTLGVSSGFTTQTYPNFQRAYYERMVLDSIRMKSILVPYAKVKEEFGDTAVQSRTMTFTELMDLEPNWNTTTETSIWFRGGSLDSRTVTLSLEIFHDVIKWGDLIN